MKLKIDTDFCSESALQYKQKIFGILSAKNPLVVDITETTCIDIIGINTLAMSFKTSQNFSVDFSLIVKHNSEAFRLLEMTNFINIIPNNIVYS